MAFATQSDYRVCTALFMSLVRQKADPLIVTFDPDVRRTSVIVVVYVPITIVHQIYETSRIPLVDTTLAGSTFADLGSTSSILSSDLVDRQNSAWLTDRLARFQIGR